MKRILLLILLLAPVQANSAWEELMKLYQDHGMSTTELLRGPASQKSLAEWQHVVGQPLPAELRRLYLRHDGQEWLETKHGHSGPIFDGYEFLSVKDTIAEYKMWRGLAEQEGAKGMAEFAESVTAEPEVQRQYWREGWVIFARDGGGNALAIDLAPTSKGVKGQVIVMGPDEDHRYVLADSLDELLIKMVKSWRSGTATTMVQGGELWVDFEF